MTISACMIAKNEERCIARCIKSYRNIVKEVIVVDTGSTDRTIEIAESLGAKVIRMPWQNDFSLAKNRALKEASGDWIIFLDADEYLTEGCAQKLFNFIKQEAQTRQDVDTVWVRGYDLLESGGQEHSPYMRIFRNHRGLHYEGAIHEALRAPEDKTLVSVTAPVETISFQHDGYADGKLMGKTNRNFEIIQSELAAGNQDPILYYYLTQHYNTIGDFERTLENARIHLTRDTSSLVQVLRTMIRADHAYQHTLPDNQGRMQLAQDAIKRYPSHPTSHLIAGNAYYAAGDLETAHTYYTKTLQLRETFEDPLEFSTNFVDELYPELYYRIARYHQKKGQMDQALEHFNAALLRRPHMYPALLGFLQCSRMLDDNKVAATLVTLYKQAIAEQLEIVLDIVGQCRCDLIYLVIFEKWFALKPMRDHRFFTMQIIIKEYKPVVKEIVNQFRCHPQWNGSFEGMIEGLTDDMRLLLEKFIVDAAIAALLSEDELLIEQVLSVSPGALADALTLCLGREVPHLRDSQLHLCQLVGKHLALFDTKPALQEMWREVLGCFETMR